MFGLIAKLHSIASYSQQLGFNSHISLTSDSECSSTGGAPPKHAEFSPLEKSILICIFNYITILFY